MPTSEKYLRLLAKDYPKISMIRSEIIRLQSLCDLPKGTEYFFSDLHGEDGAFIHMLRSASGQIRVKIRQQFDGVLTESEQNQLANLIYNPEKVLRIVRQSGRADRDWLQSTIDRLVELGRSVSVKYRRGSVEEKMPPEFASILRELIFSDSRDLFRHDYCAQIIAHIVDSDVCWSFIAGLCVTIQRVCVNQVHIIGDIFDRGNGPHKIMEELIRFDAVDIQWGNHDVVWIGAACGNQVAMCSVLRVAIAYDNFDMLEQGYGLSLRALTDFAKEVYGDDPCDRFRIKSYEENVYTRIDPDLAARMQKAIAVIMFKLESQLIARHPEYDMANRDVLRLTDFRRMVFRDGEVEHPLLDTNFPTIDPDDPSRLTPAEEDLMRIIDASFRYSEPLHRHTAWLYSHGDSYKCVNGNLLFHGCVPLTEDGRFDGLTIDGKFYAGKELLDYVGWQMHNAYYNPNESKYHQDAVDFTWYLWCGSKSPMFGKSKMSTFENYFVADKEVRREVYNPYFELSKREGICDMILTEFGLPTDRGHIINGHVPVKILKGETPVKGGGKLYVIDGGIAKAYHAKTGIAGYTLIFDSHSLALAEHTSFAQIENDMGSYTPKITITEEMPRRIMIADTDLGVELRERIADLQALRTAYEKGTIKEQR